MTIKAKFAGRCQECSGRIGVGETIEWSKDGGSKHAKCVRPSWSPAAKTSAPASTKSKTASETARCEYCRSVKPTRKRPCKEPCPVLAREVGGQVYEDCDRWHRACRDCVA